MGEAVGGTGRGGNEVAEVGMEGVVVECYENIRAKTGRRAALGVVLE